MSPAQTIFKSTAAAIVALGLATAMPDVAGAQTVGVATLQLTAYKQALAEQMGEDDAVAAFYRGRAFAPVWTGTSDADRARRAALLDAFSMAGAHGLPERRFDADALMTRMRAVRTGRDRGELEIALTRAYLDFAQALQSGVLEPRQAVRGIKRERPLRDAGELLSALMASDDPRAHFRELPPASPEYTRLLRAKLLLERRIARGGWGMVVATGKLEPGDSGPNVVALRDRLIAMGYLTPNVSAVYDPALRAAVTAFQEAHGLTPDGIAGGGTLKEINTPPEDRLKSVIVAMERERWLNRPEGVGNRQIRVNLTDFHSEIIDDGKVIFRTRSVIGDAAPDRRTPEFSDVMEYMVINPSWYVPRSIVVKEYLPLLRSNRNAVGHLQILGRNGRTISRSQGFSQYTAQSFPYGMRQPPGPKNALGTVKFMFPNKYNIYLHDTPTKSLFEREVRAFSHGCIRLSEPHEFAYTLLSKQSDDPEGLFQSILRTKAETRVALDQPVPVHLIYRTAFTRAKGPMQYRRDLYGRDAKLWQALANAGVALLRSEG